MDTGDAQQKSRDLPPHVVTALNRGHVVEAIKLLRDERGIGLKEAKEAVDRHLAAHPALKRKLESEQAESLRGCLLWLAALIGIATVAYYLIAAK